MAEGVGSGAVAVGEVEVAVAMGAGSSPSPPHAANAMITMRGATRIAPGYLRIGTSLRRDNSSPLRTMGRRHAIIGLFSRKVVPAVTDLALSSPQRQ